MACKLRQSNDNWAAWEGGAGESVTLFVRAASGSEGQVLITAARYNNQDLTPQDVACAGATHSGVKVTLAQGRKMLTVAYARSSPNLTGELLECCGSQQTQVIDPLVDVNVRGYRLLGL